MKKTVLILFGGQSSEHDVSRVSARNVLENINKEKYNLVTVGITKDGRWLLYDGPLGLMDNGDWQSYAETNALENTSTIQSPRDFLFSFAKRKGFQSIDVVFPVMHGINCEDGTMQGLLELCNVPYVGPGVLGSAMSMDKDISKLVFEKANIPQGNYFTVDRKQLDHDMDAICDKAALELGFPCFVKPANAGSSVGVGKAKDRENLVDVLKAAAPYDKKILVEQYINGREIECSVLGNDEPIASPIGEIIPGNDFYDYSAKYLDNSSVCVIPAQVPKETATQIRNYAIKAYKALQCTGLSRVDFFLEKETDEIFINEINTLPGFTSISMYPMMWAEEGMSYSKLIDELLFFAIEHFMDVKREIDA